MKRVYQITMKNPADGEYLIKAESSNKAMNILAEKKCITTYTIYAINVLDYLDDALDLEPNASQKLVFGIRVNRGKGKDQYVLASNIGNVSDQYPSADAVWQNNDQEVIE